MAMLQQDKPLPPGVFMSFSCADFYWKQMLEYLAKHLVAVEPTGTYPNDEPPDLLRDENSSLHFAKLQEYAHIVTLFYEQRIGSFIANVLGPMLKIKVHYDVAEFQTGRGQIHIHLLAFLEDGEPHSLMHQAPPEGIVKGGADAKRAWERVIESRESDPCVAAPLAALKEDAIALGDIMTTGQDQHVSMRLRVSVFALVARCDVLVPE